jgi:hypothetical protein
MHGEQSGDKAGIDLGATQLCILTCEGAVATAVVPSVAC